MTRSIYKFHVDCGHAGSLEDTFAAKAEDIAFAIGKTLYFTEPWGKHSGVEVTLGDDAFSIVSSDPAEVATFDRLDLGSGDNPLALLHDSIADGRFELTDEEKLSAPAYLRSAFREDH